MDQSRRRSRASHPGQTNRRIVYILLFLVVAGVMAFGAWRWKGRAYYARWRDERLLDQAEGFVKDGKFGDASVAARRIFNADNNNLRANVIMADVAEKLSMRDAVHWRQRVADLDPLRYERLIEWAQTALRFSDFPAVRVALDRFPADQRDSVFFHETAGATYFGLGDLIRSEFHFSKALASHPQDDSKKLNLAKVQLQSSDSRVRETGRKVLHEIPDSSTNYPIVLGLLTTDALQQKDLESANSYSKRLMDHPNGTYLRRFARLNVLKLADPPGMTNLLHQIQADAPKNLEELTYLLAWMNANGYASSALAWVRGQPQEVFKQISTGMAVADLYATVGDWLGLRNWVRSADWAYFQCFRYGYEARAVANLPKDSNTDATVKGLWQKAIDATQRNGLLLETLANFASSWGMPQQREDTWWSVASGGAGQENALMILYREYLFSENTMGQYRVARQLLRLNPNNLVAKNNSVYLGLLQKIDAPELLRLADELYQAAPDNPGVVATYAFALHRQNRLAEGLAKLAALPAASLEDSGVAFTHAYLLSLSGDKEGAARALKFTETGRFLPEETRMLDEIRERIKK